MCVRGSACLFVCVYVYVYVECSMRVSVSVIIVDFPNLYELHLFAFSAAGHRCFGASVALLSGIA